MRSPYRRRVKITFLSESEKEAAHGWATTTKDGAEVKHYFKVDQPRFITTIDNAGVSTICLQFERNGVFPEKLTVVHPHNTFTFTALSLKREQRRRHQQAA